MVAKANHPYRLVKEIARGGFATVYRAVHRQTGEVVAFKRLRSRWPSSEALARLRREIEVQGDIAHPNIMPVLDRAEDYSWYTMPLADRVLSDMDRPISDENVSKIVQACATGLGAAHQRGILHRDVTPRNIMHIAPSGEDGRWVIADFGLVRRPHGMTTEPHTVAGQAFGTAGYAAPESEEDAHEMSEQSDIYSLGRVVAWAVTKQTPRPNRPLIPLSGPWRHFIEATTAEHPSRRPKSMQEVRTLLPGVVPGSISVQAQPWLLGGRGSQDEPQPMPNLAPWGQVLQPLANNFTEYHDPEGRFTLRRPSDWTIRQVVDGTVYFRQPGPLLGVQVALYDGWLSDSIDDADRIIDEQISQRPEYVPLVHEKINVGPYRGYRRVFQHRNDEGRQEILIRIYFICGDWLYNVYGFMLPSQHGHVEPLVDGLAGSITTR